MKYKVNISGSFEIDLEEIVDVVPPEPGPDPTPTPEPDPTTLYEFPNLTGNESYFSDGVDVNDLLTRVTDAGLGGHLETWSVSDLNTTNQVNMLRGVEARYVNYLVKGLSHNFLVPTLLSLTSISNYAIQNRLMQSILWCCVYIDECKKKGVEVPQSVVDWLKTSAEHPNAKYGRNQPGGILYLVVGYTLRGIDDDYANTTMDAAWTFMTNPVGAEGSGDWRNLPEMDYYTPNGGNAEGSGTYLNSWKHVLPFFYFWRLVTGQDLWNISPSLSSLWKYILCALPGEKATGSYWRLQTGEERASSLAAMCMEFTNQGYVREFLANYINRVGLNSDDGRYLPLTFFALFGRVNHSTQTPFIPYFETFGGIGHVYHDGEWYKLMAGQSEYMGYRALAPGVISLSKPDGTVVVPATKAGTAKHYYWRYEYGWPYASTYQETLAGGVFTTQPAFSGQDFNYGTELPPIPQLDKIGELIVEENFIALVDDVREVDRFINIDNDTNTILVTDNAVSGVTDNELVCVWPFINQPTQITSKIWTVDGFRFEFNHAAELVEGLGISTPVNPDDSDYNTYPQFGNYRLVIRSAESPITTTIRPEN